MISCVLIPCGCAGFSVPAPSSQLVSARRAAGVSRKTGIRTRRRTVLRKIMQGSLIGSVEPDIRKLRTDFNDCMLASILKRFYTGVSLRRPNAPFYAPDCLSHGYFTHGRAFCSAFRPARGQKAFHL